MCVASDRVTEFNYTPKKESKPRLQVSSNRTSNAPPQAQLLLHKIIKQMCIFHCCLPVLPVRSMQITLFIAKKKKGREECINKRRVFLK